jgi:hypothetical protein
MDVRLLPDVSIRCQSKTYTQSSPGGVSCAPVGVDGADGGIGSGSDPGGGAGCGDGRVRSLPWRLLGFFRHNIFSVH